MSKDLFELMRMQEIETQNFLPNKKEIQFSSKKFITDLLENGEHNIHELLAQSKRISEALEVVNSEILKRLPDENFEAFGLKGTFRNGGESYNYKEDYLYEELSRKLKDREELIKYATNASEPVYGSDGVEVTKVSKTPRKSSLSITF